MSFSRSSSLFFLLATFWLLLVCQSWQPTFAFVVPKSNAADTKNPWRTPRLHSSFEDDVSPSDTAADEDYNESEYANDNDDDINGSVKAELLQAIQSRCEKDDKAVVFGFGDAREDDADKKTIINLAQSLETAKYVVPLATPSTWRLLYTNTPDILGLQGGPLSQLVSIQQEISHADDEAASMNTLPWVLTYKPNSNGIIPQLLENVLEDLSQDRLTQKVSFACQEQSMNVFDLKLLSTTVESTRFGSLPTLPFINGPFVGAFKIGFNDGELRIERSVQGDFLAIYKRTM